MGLISSVFFRLILVLRLVSSAAFLLYFFAWLLVVLLLKNLYGKSRCTDLEKCKVRIEGWTKDRRVDGKQPELRPSKGKNGRGAVLAKLGCNTGPGEDTESLSRQHRRTTC